MIPEPIEDEIESPEMAGIVGFRLTILKDDAEWDIKSKTVKINNDTEVVTNNWAKKLRRRPESAKIRCYLF